MNKEELIVYLRELGNGEKIPAKPKFGLCYVLDRQEGNYSDLLRDNVHKWDLYSGDRDYPVPCTDNKLNPKDAYMDYMSLWVLGETKDTYLLNRRKLCLWFADFLEDLPEDE